MASTFSEERESIRAGWAYLRAESDDVAQPLIDVMEASHLDLLRQCARLVDTFDTFSDEPIASRKAPTLTLVGGES